MEKNYFFDPVNNEYIDRIDFFREWCRCGCGGYMGYKQCIKNSGFTPLTLELFTMTISDNENIAAYNLIGELLGRYDGKNSIDKKFNTCFIALIKKVSDGYILILSI